MQLLLLYIPPLTPTGHALITQVWNNACANVLFTRQDFNQLPGLPYTVTRLSLKRSPAYTFLCPPRLPAGCRQESAEVADAVGADVFVYIFFVSVYTEAI